MTYKSGAIQCELSISDMSFLSDAIYQLTIHRIENGFSDHDNVLQDYSYFQGFFEGIVTTHKGRKDKVIKISFSNVRLYRLCELLKLFCSLKAIEGVKDKESADEKARTILGNLSTEYANFLA